MPSSLGRVLLVEDEPRVAAMLRDVEVDGLYDHQSGDHHG
jgi:hypothetical protein